MFTYFAYALLMSDFTACQRILRLLEFKDCLSVHCLKIKKKFFWWLRANLANCSGVAMKKTSLLILLAQTEVIIIDHATDDRIQQL